MITLTFYHRPLWRAETIPVLNVSEEDERYIEENDVKLSAEDDVVHGGFVVYFDHGALLDDEETPDEIIVFSMGRSSAETIAEGVRKVKERKDARKE